MFPNRGIVDFFNLAPFIYLLLVWQNIYETHSFSPWCSLFVQVFLRISECQINSVQSCMYYEINYQTDYSRQIIHMQSGKLHSFKFIFQSWLLPIFLIYIFIHHFHFTFMLITYFLLCISNSEPQNELLIKILTKAMVGN